MAESRGSSTLFLNSRKALQQAGLRICALLAAHLSLFLLFPERRASAANFIWAVTIIILGIKSYYLSGDNRESIRKSWQLMILYSVLLCAAFLIKLYYSLMLPHLKDNLFLPFIFFSANITMAALLFTMSRSGKTPYDMRRQLYLIGIILFTLLILSYVLNIYGYSGKTEFLHLVRSLIFSHSAIFVIIAGISIYWMNIWKKDWARKIIFTCLLSGITLSYTVSILFYTPKLLANEVPEGGFPDILLTFSLSLFIAASEFEKLSPRISNSSKHEKRFNLLYVSRTERIIPALCLSLIVLVLFYKKNYLGNEIITVLAILMLPFIILTALFEWSSYRSESWFLFMLSRTPMGIQITDKNMEKNLFINNSFCDLFHTVEIPPDTILSQTPEVIRPGLLEGIRTGEGVDKTELILKRPDNSEFHAQIKITTAIYYSQDIIIYWVNEITERKNFEEQILRQRDSAETSNRYRGTLLENISSKMLSGYIIGKIKETDDSIDLVLTGMNKQAMEILGTDEYSLNKSFSELFPKPSPMLIGAVKKVFKTGESSRIEIFSHRLGKHLLIVLFTGSKDEILCLINDITDARKTEKELLEREREIRNLMANLPGMAYRCINNNNWTMLFVSQGSIKLSGFTPEEITTGVKSWNDIIHPDDRGNVWLTVQKAIDEKSYFHAEYRIITKHGEIKHVWEKGTGVYDDSGKLLFLEGFMLDVTKQVEAETALRQSEEKLRQTEKLNAISQMAGGIAHDLNNNLMAIQSLSSLIELKAADKGLKKYTDSINEVIGKASHLIDKLETFAKKKDLSSEILSVNLMLQNITSLLKEIFPDNIEIYQSLNAVKDHCRGDQIQLDNAFLYICMNSKEAMPMGGSLTIETDNIYLNREFFNTADKTRQPGEYLRITITDTGSGIEKQDLKRIFEPFFTTKPVGKGTGLSLSAVFGTIESHNGIITVNSETGSGASFIIYLPLA